jgi:hypothetical protein
MPGAIITKQMRDGNGTLINMRMWDESGAGTGPFSFMQVLGADGVKLAKAEDAVHTTADEGIMSLAVRKDTATGLGADGDYVPLIVDASGRLHIAALVAGSAVIGKVDHSSTGIGHGVTTVTTAGTDVALAGSTAAKWVTIQSQTDNTGWIAVGATGVDATEATGNGVLLDAGESVTLPIDNLADIFIDSTVNGEGVRYTYGT